MNVRAFHPWAGLLPSIVVIGAAALMPIKPRSAALASAGAIVAALGVITLGRPVIRLGYKEWRKSSQTIDGGYFTPDEEPPAYKAEAREQDRDAAALQIVGPLLVVGDTLLNGFSGFA